MTSFDIIISRLDGIDARISKLENTVAIIARDVHDLEISQQNFNARLEDLKTFMGLGFAVLGIVIGIARLFRREKKESPARDELPTKNFLAELLEIMKFARDTKEKEG